MIIGYTTGAFDLLHVGHLNMLRNAKSLCDKLIVGVSTDELIQDYKQKTPVYSFVDRCEIVRSIKYVDMIIPQVNMNKYEAWEKLKFNKVFVGDDWYKTEKWENIEQQFSEVDVSVIYFPYTQGMSSTKIHRELIERAQLAKG